MRFRRMVCIAVLFVAPALLAQSNRVSIYISNPGIVSSDYLGTHYTGGAAVSLTHLWSPRFASELVAGAERDYSGYVAFNRDGSVREKQNIGYTTYPIDLLAQYRFRTDSRWTPYFGAGMRYVHRPRIFMTGTQLTPEVNGGTVFRASKRLGIVLDGRFSGAHSVNWNPMFKASAGLSWAF
jgi:opacity protein-like surface antigen